MAVLTGAGISAESGVPTFRDAQTGLWERYRPEDLATPEAFARDPELVWSWYAWRRELVGGVEPNAGHRALVDLEVRVPRFTLATQNVDGLHRRAGNRNVLELHGDISRTICSRERVAVDTEGVEGEPPACPECGAYLRPEVVWFGEALPTEAFERAHEAACESDVFLSVGHLQPGEPRSLAAAGGALRWCKRGRGEPGAHAAHSARRLRAASSRGRGAAGAARRRLRMIRSSSSA